MARLILFTGKGGVGKTSVASAHAVKSAGEGKRTLLVSADMAHNIGDMFGKPVGKDPVLLAENLYGLELDPDTLAEEFPAAFRAFEKLAAPGRTFGESRGAGLMLPGLENLLSLLGIKKLQESGEYDRILVDCAPSGETLSLLRLPEMLSWYMEKFFPVGKTMVRVLAPVSKLRFRAELPDREAMNEMEELHRELVRLERILRDGENSSVRLVCIPEKMVVEETKRLFMYLNLYGYRTDGVYINRVIPEEADNPFFAGWRETQRQYREELKRVFFGLPVKEIPWYPGEILGRESLRWLAEDVLAGPDIFSLRAKNEGEMYEKVPGGYCLLLSVPGAALEEIRVQSHDLDLDIILPGAVRRIPLPDVLRGITPSEVTFRDGKLSVRFETGEE